MSDYLDPLTAWPCDPPEGYRGQLEPDFQRRRAAIYSGLTPADCTWYHSTELPDGSVFEGDWDLRGGEQHYLGETSLAGKSVLEFGPASGHLTFWMEAQGARVTAFEVGYDAVIHLVPPPADGDVANAQASLMAHTRRTTNAWWYLHRAHRSNARLVHGDLSQLPDDLGQYDVVALGSILLHVRDTFRALEQAASHAADTIMVTEPALAGLEGDEPLVRFWTNETDLGPSVTWWRFSPGALSTMLWRLGFTRTRVVRHTQRYRTSPGHFVETPLFTVVARRSTAPQTSMPDWMLEARQHQEQRARRLVDTEARLSAANEQLALLRDAATELDNLRSTRTFRWTAPLRDAYRRLR